ncbi:hypothetical protein Y1Q_0014363 [Alligator mississippiensis]|uniref:Uncharacterized protein n=1 Tax=Alligator mississippiensis TaxID=8496 RepID=A0A151N266_ALLMI|nr:hypothetical protein Y1Q_0014363 [Alligator mississippiensis]
MSGPLRRFEAAVTNTPNILHLEAFGGLISQAYLALDFKLEPKKVTLKEEYISHQNTKKLHHEVKILLASAFEIVMCLYQLQHLGVRRTRK